ncbi:DUF6221 family protein [Streptomyces hirsutus]|uniref:DUF6221 family protein n=1 Tax=Streptomyces hirsutus TaxID=35620 RepID=UPI00368187AF
MDDLVQWLLAQLDADRRDAEARCGIFPSPGVRDDGAVALHVRPGGNMAITWYRNPAEGWDDMAKLRNWADTENGWTQERVLREIDAKRRAIDHYLAIRQHAVQGEEPYVLAEGAVAKQIQIMAMAYAGRPGYLEKWRP